MGRWAFAEPLRDSWTQSHYKKKDYSATISDPKEYTDEIRAAYRAKVKLCHPDQFQDEARRKSAQEEMIRLNLAYEEALKLAAPRQHAAYEQQLPKDEAVQLANRMLERNHAESALRQLDRSTERDAAWYFTRGQVYMVLEQYENAHVAFREAINRNPDNNTYRAADLDAVIAIRKAGTLSGKMEKFVRDLKKKAKRT